MVMQMNSNPKLGEDYLTHEERILLLKIAREALDYGVQGKRLPALDLASMSDRLRAKGASFVTLTISGELRGCIGSLEATRPLAEDVRVHAVAAAIEDYRFPPVTINEVSQLAIEISRLTAPRKLNFQDPDELLSIIRPGVDGIILRMGIQRATFLPQVWEKVPDKKLFLSMLCRKMGAASDCWRRKHTEVYTYQVEKFSE